MAQTYEFRIAGHVSDELIASFEPATAAPTRDAVVFTHDVRDSSELFGILGRIETLGLHLLSLRCLEA